MSPSPPDGSEYVSALSPQTTWTACPLPFPIRRDRGFAVRLLLLLFHSSQACDTLPLVDMNLWKLQFSSLPRSHRVISSCLWTWQSGAGGTGSHEHKACGAVRTPGRASLRANCNKESVGSVRHSNACSRGSMSHTVISSEVGRRSTHLFHIGNDNGM
jgi:hypothetical protein